MNGAQRLAEATRTLREHTDTGWVALRDDVVALAARAYRPSAPVRGRLPGGGELWVASTVLVSLVRAALDGVDDVGTLRLTCSTTEDDELAGVTVEIVALYGTPLVALADRVRHIAADVVAATLGLVDAPVDRVHVDVSVGDVTTDPRLL